ncbi:MAG: PAS domain S-box protein [Candidatus Cloacimonetes bacterium]|nr:PAS domain S-box protein [Candidatus Cloacimonadota bacterium]
MLNWIITKSLRKLITIFGIIIVFATWTFTIVIFSNEKRIELQHTFNDSQNIANILEKHISGIFTEIENSLFSLRKIKESNVSKNELSNLLKHFIQSKPELYNLISIIDSTGNVQLTSLEDSQPTFSGDRDFFLFHKHSNSKDVLIEKPLFGRVTNKWYIPVSMRLEDSNGKFTGVLLASINPYYFSHIFKEVNIDKKSLIYLANLEGTIFSGYSTEILLLDKKLPELNETQTKNIPKVAISDFDNIKRIQAIKFSNKKDMYLYVGISYYEHFKNFYLKIIYILGMHLLFTIIIVFIIKKINNEIKINDNLNKEINTFFNSSLDLQCICDIEGNLIRINNFWKEKLNYQETELIGKKIYSIIYPEDIETAINAFNSITETGEIIDFNNRVISKDGTIHFIEWRAVNDNNKIYISARDVCKRKKSEQTLLTLSQAVEQSPSIVMITDLAGKINYVNPKFIEITGYSLNDVKYRSVNFLKSSDEKNDNQKEPWHTIEQGRIWKGIFKNKKKDGTIFWESALISPILNDKKEIINYLKVAEDITNQKISENKLEQALEQIKALIKAIPDLIFIFNNKAEIIDYHPKDEESVSKFFLPPEKFLNKNIKEIFPEELVKNTKEKFNLVFQNNSIESLNYSLKINDKTCYFEGRYIPYHKNEILVIIRDMTEQYTKEQQHKNLQKQFIQAQKMESIGRLAGGIAHDFNNMIGVIISNIEMEQDNLDINSPTYSRLIEIKKAALRSADLTKQLLSFARKQDINPKIISLNETIKNIFKILKRLINENITLQFIEDKNINPIKIDPTQIDQLLANLCINARDAIKDNGNIIIETKNVYCDETFSEKHTYISPGAYVLLEISDNGCGMDKETLSQIFEPFFTTKKEGEGTGLGLATVYGIIKQNNGFINVYSEPNHGTSFKIYFPACKADEEVQSTTKQKPIQYNGTETILVVEDELMILNVTSSILKKIGYNVIAFNTPNKAIDYCNQSSHKIDLIITDVIMPNMNGKKLASKIKKVFPDIKILYMSGYTSNMLSQHGVSNDNINFIQKPFSVNELAEKISEILKNKKIVN